MYGAGFTTSGNPGTTRRFTLTDGGQSLATMFGAGYLRDKQEPIAFTISIETNHARVGFGSASPSVGHLVRSNGSGRWAGMAMTKAARVCNETAASNAIAQITLEY